MICIKLSFHQNSSYTNKFNSELTFTHVIFCSILVPLMGFG